MGGLGIRRRRHLSYILGSGREPKPVTAFPLSSHGSPAIADDVGPGGERSMAGHVFGLAVGDREVVVDRIDDAVNAAAIGIVNGRIAWA